jgi:hypothetical protein
MELPRYGAERHILRPKSPAAVFLDGQYKPMAVFRFKYRSKRALQAELIIPRSPSPDVVQSSMGGRSGNDTNAGPSREARLADLKVCDQTSYADRQRLTLNRAKLPRSNLRREMPVGKEVDLRNSTLDELIRPVGGVMGV